MNMNIYEKLLNAVDNLPEEAVEHTKKEITRKGYDTTGYQYQFLVNILNENLGFDGWGYETRIVRELQGTFKNGTTYHEVGMETEIWIKNGGSELAKRKCYGGHRSDLWGDAAKGAFTNSFKKTLGMFGVGKKAYEGTLDEDYQPIEHGSVQKKKDVKREQEREHDRNEMEVISGIKEVKTLKTGRNANGEWMLLGVTDDKGNMYTTFSKRVGEIASVAKAESHIVKIYYKTKIFNDAEKKEIVDMQIVDDGSNENMDMVKEIPF